MLTRAYNQPPLSARDVSIPRLSETGDVSTQTIDLSNLFSANIHETASFDLRSVQSSSLGSLLDALPMPAFLIDSYYCVAFANNSCSKINQDLARIKGLRFAELLPYPKDATKAHELVCKAQSLLETAFETRKPSRAEAILEIAGNKLWCRLHIRSVRLTSERYLLVILEDITHERAEQRLRQREEMRLRKVCRSLESALERRTSEFQEAEARAREESARLKRAKEMLLSEKKSLGELFHLVPMPMLIIGDDGTVRDVNSAFAELFGYLAEDLPFPPEWLTDTFGEVPPEGSSGSSWADTLSALASGQLQPLAVTVRTNEGIERKTVLTALKTDRGDLVVVCQDAPVRSTE